MNRYAAPLAVFVVAVAALLSSCASDAAVSEEDFGPLPGECDPAVAVPGDACGGGTLFSVNYQGVGILLVAADVDTPTVPGVAYRTSNTDSGAANDFGDGRNNTGTFNSEHPASAACQAYTSGRFADWYLPAHDELLELQTAIFSSIVVPGIDSAAPYEYWSSTQYELDHTMAWAVDLSGGPTWNGKTGTFPVRCIRRPYGF